MSARQPVPAPFREWVELSADALGTFVVHATDDYFAAKENLLKPGPPLWLEDEYTDRGKWMDGWESQRKREEGHDHATLRLGAPGRIRGVLVDTTHFKGNAPMAVRLEGIEAPYTATAAELEAAPGWFELWPQTGVKADTQNLLTRRGPSERVTHVRLHLHPDGGVARLRIYGEVAAEPRIFWRAGSVDLGAVENGATIAAVSDEFFGPPSNMLLPGRGVNMGDGWETKRRRTPGSDWAVVRLARPGVIERVELDTHFFKGNAPQAALLEALDASGLDARSLARTLRSPAGWQVLVERTALIPHRRHAMEPRRPMLATHVRAHIFPHGGVNRLRLWGQAADTKEEASAVAALNRLTGARARALLHSFCGAERWVGAMLARRPLPSVRALFAAAEEALWSLRNQDWLEAFAAHPRIGESKRARQQTARSATWSRGEQRGVAGAEKATVAELAALNARYLEKFGFIFIVCASGKSAAQLLELLRERVGRSRAQELETAADEQAKITRLRIEKWLTGRQG